MKRIRKNYAGISVYLSRPVKRIAAKKALAIVERRLGLTPDDPENMEARLQAVQSSFLPLREKFIQKLTSGTGEDEIKARFAAIASQLNIEELDSDADIETQQKTLVKAMKEADIQRWEILMQDAYEEAQLQKPDTQSTQGEETELNQRPGVEDLHEPLAKSNIDGVDYLLLHAVLAKVYGLELDEVKRIKDRRQLLEAVRKKASRFKYLEEELERIRTPNAITRPEVLEALDAVEKVLKIDDQDNANDVYLRRQIIFEQVQRTMEETSQQIHEEAQRVLKAAEEALEIKVNEGDTNLERLNKVRAQVEKDGDATIKMLTDKETILWEEIPHLSTKLK